MSTLSKRMKSAKETVDATKVYPLRDAVKNITQFPKVKFDETVELHFHLNLDLKATDQAVRGTVALPHGVGKKVRIAVFCTGDNVQKAKDAGADHVGGADLVTKVAAGFMDFDSVVATPDMMREISKLGKVLGPRGLMPSPKAGTVTTDVVRTINELKAGRIEFKSDKQGGIHVGIGKRSFNENQIFENATHVIDAINHAKPSSVKGNLIRTLAIATTMGPGIKVAL
jgi:large subunit ribosomal protein L1